MESIASLLIIPQSLDATIALLFSKFEELSNFTILHTDSVESIELTQYDVLVTDQPQLLEKANLCNLPIILITENADIADSISKITQGYDNVITYAQLELLPIMIVKAFIVKEYKRETIQADSIMRLSEQRYRRLFENAKDAIVVLNGRNKKIVDVNPEFLELLELDKYKIIGRTPNLITKAITPDWETILAELSSKTTLRVNNVKIITLCEKEIIADISAAKFLEGGHDIIQASLREITERYRVEEALRSTVLQLRANEERHRMLSDQAPTAIIIVDTASQKIEYSNDKTAAIFGSSITNYNFYQIFSNASRAREILETVIECGVILDHEEELVIKGRKTKAIMNSELTLFAGRNVVHVLLDV